MKLDLASGSTLRSAASALAVRGGGLGLSFAIGLLLARTIGADGLGAYYLVVAVTYVVAVVSRVGLDNPILRFVAEAWQNEERGQARGVLRTGLFLTLVPALVLTVFLTLAAGPLARLFDNAGLEPLFRLAALAIVPFVAVTLLGEALKGAGHAARAQFVQFVAVPAGMIGAFLLGGRLFGAKGAISSHVVATWIALCAALLIWRRVASSENGQAPRFPARTLLASGLPLLFVSSMVLVNSWADTILLGVIRTPEEVGHYGVAMRVAGLITLPLFVSNSLVAPRVVRHFQAGDLDACSRVARKSSRLLAMLALPVLVAFLAAPAWILGVFGEGFEQASNALRILAVAYYASVTMGPSAQILAVTGHERTLLVVNVGTTTLNVALNLVLIPAYGIVGAAVATGMTVVLAKIVLLVHLRRSVGIRIA